MTFRGDEMPQRAALDCLAHELPLDASESALINSDKFDGSYLPPITLKYTRDPQQELISYLYLYCLDEHIDAPKGWSWSPVEALPEKLRLAVPECTP